MHHALLKLLSIASTPIGEPINGAAPIDAFGTLGKELAALLTAKNGFYAYESALLVRPLSNAGNPLGMLEWNASSLWKEEFHENLGNAIFFAEDVFGGQFCIRESKVCTFDPEGGSFEEISESLGSWAEEIMSEFPFRTGYSLAHDWQIQNGALTAGKRLLPKTPFLLGGKYELENLHAIDETEGILFRASIANQIRSLPDGAQVVIKAPNDARPNR